MQLPADSIVALSPQATAAWRIRALLHAPKYFELDGWIDRGTVLARAGTNLVQLEVDAPRYVAWNRRACGAAVAPNRQTLAWTDCYGAIRTGRRRGPERELLAARTRSPHGGEGDPSGLVLWSPDGARILTSWMAEWESFYAVIDVRTGERTAIRTRLPGYFLTAAHMWLDERRILFSAQAVADLHGRSVYHEAGGYRADLAVYDLADSSYRRVTTVADGVFLRPFAPWGEGVLVGEAVIVRARFSRYWIFDTRDWSRRELLLPAGNGVALADTTAVLVLDRSNADAVRRVTHAILVHPPTRTVLPLLSVAGWPRVEWSPDGRRLALSTVVEQADTTGAFGTRARVFIIEQRAVRTVQKRQDGTH